ncbi:Polypeptide N-acetylgalactosaminyltransferase-like 6 [Triplophysa tibetana]|uniref:Polypeptide N-acetylgalactosaminyltransferase-like 6 n=1 Tax=Triplophysa tibetana TaxID=1572043 RepID=A0A5A9PK73_9TELE|nr:Polypeptide N-acetylgalactosaminyltransferase-like 6 [Triplophysa tibetana]
MKSLAPAGRTTSFRIWPDCSTLTRHFKAWSTGKGEHGKPYLLAEDECDDSVYKENGFNIYVSNNIALDRSLPDIRHPNCKQKLYLEKLPNTSIIIPFHNEGWSSLLRTIHSITNRTPDHLIAEIVLVDDYSDRGKLERRWPSLIFHWKHLLDIRHRTTTTAFSLRIADKASPLGVVVYTLMCEDGPEHCVKKR